MDIRLDPEFTFDTFVAGTNNQVAVGAARKVAEVPGLASNPLIIQGGAGHGKTHLLHAIGNLARRMRSDLRIEYETTERYVERLAGGVAAGTYHFKEEHLEVAMLLLDDLEFLAGKGHTQAEMLWIWDAMVAAGEQVVLASGRPLSDIDALDQRLLARFPGGMIVELNAPDLASRSELVLRAAQSRGGGVSREVAEAVARIAAGSMRELNEAISRVLDAQAERGQPLTRQDVFALLGSAPAPVARSSSEDEFGTFLEDVSGVVAEVVESAPWRNAVAAAILRWEGEGYRTKRLEIALEGDEPADVGALLDGFAADVARLRAIEKELSLLDPLASGAAVLRDPDSLADAERWLIAARTRGRSGTPPRPPPRKSADQKVPRSDAWFFDGERILWSWVGLEDRVVEEVG